MKALQWLRSSSTEKRACGSVHCWHTEPCSVTSLGSTAERPKLLIWPSSLRWFTSPNLINVPLNVCLMRWSREEYIVLCKDGLIYNFSAQNSHFKGNQREPGEDHVKTELTHLPSSVKRPLVQPHNSAHFLSSVSFRRRPQTPFTDNSLRFPWDKTSDPICTCWLSSLHLNWAALARSVLPYHPPQNGFSRM